MDLYHLGKKILRDNYWSEKTRCLCFDHDDEKIHLEMTPLKEGGFEMTFYRVDTEHEPLAYTIYSWELPAHEHVVWVGVMDHYKRLFLKQALSEFMS